MGLKSMIKQRIRMIPYNPYDLSGIEQYLSQMAEKGLHLKHLGWITVFEKGEPQKNIYRIDPMQEKYRAGDENLNPEQCAAYNEQGWTFVGTYTGIFMVYRKKPEDEDGISECLKDEDDLSVRKITDDKDSSSACEYSEDEEAFSVLKKSDDKDNSSKSNDSKDENMEATNAKNNENSIKSKKLPQVNKNNPVLTDTYTYHNLKLRSKNIPISIAPFIYFFLSRLLTRTLFVWDFTTYDLVQSNFIFYIGFIVIVFILSAISDRRTNYHIRRICYSYETGMILPDEKTKKELLSNFAGGLYIVALLSACLLLFVADKQPAQHDLSDYRGKLSYLSLNQVETIEPDQIIHDYYTSESSFLAPVQLYIVESEKDPAVTYSIDLNGGRPWMYTRYYELRFEYLSHSFFRQMIDHYLDVMSGEDITIKNLSEEAGYECYYIKTKYNQYIAGASGKKIIWIGYAGSEEFESYYKEVANILSVDDNNGR